MDLIECDLVSYTSILVGRKRLSITKCHCIEFNSTLNRKNLVEEKIRENFSRERERDRERDRETERERER